MKMMRRERTKCTERTDSARIPRAKIDIARERERGEGVRKKGDIRAAQKGERRSYAVRNVSAASIDLWNRYHFFLAACGAVVSARSDAISPRSRAADDFPGREAPFSVW